MTDTSAPRKIGQERLIDSSDEVPTACFSQRKNAACCGLASDCHYYVIVRTTAPSGQERQWIETSGRKALKLDETVWRALARRGWWRKGRCPRPRQRRRCGRPRRASESAEPPAQRLTAPQPEEPAGDSPLGRPGAALEWRRGSMAKAAAKLCWKVQEAEGALGCVCMQYDQVYRL